MPNNTNPMGLPYPVQADPVDVAGDVQRLAQAVNDALQHIMVPIPVAKALADRWNLPSSSIGARKDITGLSVQITNPSTVFNLLVHVAQEGWGYIKGDIDHLTVAMYAEPAISGGTLQWSSQARMESANPAGSQKNLRNYTDMVSHSYVILKPGQSLTAQGQVWVSSNVTDFSKWGFQFRGASIVAAPVGWCSAPGSAWVDPDDHNTDTPDPENT